MMCRITSPNDRTSFEGRKSYLSSGKSLAISSNCRLMEVKFPAIDCAGVGACFCACENTRTPAASITPQVTHVREIRFIEFLLVGSYQTCRVYGVCQTLNYNFRSRMRRVLAKLGRCFSNVTGVSLARISNDLFPLAYAFVQLRVAWTSLS